VSSFVIRTFVIDSSFEFRHSSFTNGSPSLMTTANRRPLDTFTDADRDLRFFPADPAKARTMTAAEGEHYNTHGYVKSFPIFTGAQVEANRRFFDDLLESFTKHGRDSYAINGYHTSCEGIYDIVKHPRILDLVEDIL